MAALTQAGPGRERRLALLATAVWLVLVGAYAFGFYAPGGDAPRPLLAGEVALLLLALIVPPVLFLIAAQLMAQSARLARETAEVSRALAALREEPGRGVPSPAAPELAAALVQAARLAGAEERAALFQAVHRLEIRSADMAGEDPARAEAQREEIRAALARLEERTRAALDERAETQREAQAAAAERAEIRQALRLIEAAETRRAEAVEVRNASEASAADEREDIRAALRRMEDSAARAAEERAALIAVAEALARERDEIRAALRRIEDGAGGGVPVAGGLDDIRAALARMEQGAAAMMAERATLLAEAQATQSERDEIRAALARMEARALDAESILAERQAMGREREELRAALARMEANAAANLEDEARRHAELIAATAEREAIRSALARMEVSAAGSAEERERAEAERAEILQALARMEERARGLLAEQARAEAERAETERERADIRDALLRMEERTRSAQEMQELLIAEREAAQRERDEIRAAMSRLEAKAAAAAEDTALIRHDRDAAARERDELRAALTRFEDRTLGTVEEERAALAETLARLETLQITSGEVLSAFLERSVVAEDLARLRRRVGAKAARTDDRQPGLPLGQAAEAVADLDWTDILRALNFPKDEADREGFRALRRARTDKQLADCLQAAEDVLTLLSQDGIYMDDLAPEEVDPDLWIAFAEGQRGPGIRALGSIDDEAALAVARRRVKHDAIFRDASLHFIRRFDPVLRRMVEEAGPVELHALSATRSGRAFMLLARVHGAFD